MTTLQGLHVVYSYALAVAVCAVYDQAMARRCIINSSKFDRRIKCQDYPLSYLDKQHTARSLTDEIAF